MSRDVAKGFCFFGILLHFDSAEDTRLCLAEGIILIQSLIAKMKFSQSYLEPMRLCQLLTPKTGNTNTTQSPAIESTPASHSSA